MQFNRECHLADDGHDLEVVRAAPVVDCRKAQEGQRVYAALQEVLGVCQVKSTVGAHNAGFCAEDSGKTRQRAVAEQGRIDPVAFPSLREPHARDAEYQKELVGL